MISGSIGIVTAAASDGVAQGERQSFRASGIASNRPLDRDDNELSMLKQSSPASQTLSACDAHREVELLITDSV
jgi:hypothetical protein